MQISSYLILSDAAGAAALSKFSSSAGGFAVTDQAWMIPWTRDHHELCLALRDAAPVGTTLAAECIGEFRY